MRLRRPALIAALLALLVACAPRAPEAPAPALLRNPTVPLAGSTRFAPARFAGPWQAVACLGPCAAREDWALGAGGLLLRRRGEAVTAFRATGPGLIAATEGAERLVIMWLDEGHRTAAVGDPEGIWAAILNRTRPAPADRLAAAREVLDFNGWDVSKLRKIEK